MLDPVWHFWTQPSPPPPSPPSTSVDPPSLRYMYLANGIKRVDSRNSTHMTSFANETCQICRHVRHFSTGQTFFGSQRATITVMGGGWGLLALRLWLTLKIGLVAVASTG